MDFVEKRQSDGVSEFQAYKDALKRILCSPSFLYLDEPTQKMAPSPIMPWHPGFLFFLVLVPDEKLLTQARKGRLSNENTLKEIRRLLKDRKRTPSSRISSIAASLSRISAPNLPIVEPSPFTTPEQKPHASKRFCSRASVEENL